MKFNIIYKASLAVAAMMTMVLTSCDDSNKSSLHLDGETYIQSLNIGGFEGEIDNLAKTVKVGVPVDCDAATLTVKEITVSPGAEADVKVGEVINCTTPRNIRVTNQDVFTDYTMTVIHDNVTFTSFTLDNKYPGVIDNVARTILVFVPIDANVSAMLAMYTLSEGGSAVPESSTVVDFTEPVEFTATFRSAVVKYTVTVIKDDMSQEPKAFVGFFPSVDQLGAESKEAAQWMLNNVPNTRYVSLEEILSGSVKLSEFKMVWCHFDWTDWPSILWDTRDIFNDYFIKGGNMLCSRDGARYINDVWRITRDQQSPNNMFGGDSEEVLTEDYGFNVAGHEGHPIYNDLPIEDNRILLVSAGCSNTNRTLQWVVDWDPYQSMEGWSQRTGAVALASDNWGDLNHVTIAEIPSSEVLNGYASGVVLVVGTPSYEWHQNVGENLYRPTMEQLTKNAINYLCK